MLLQTHFTMPFMSFRQRCEKRRNAGQKFEMAHKNTRRSSASAMTTKPSLVQPALSVGVTVSELQCLMR
jgi:hypothetical protein